MRLRVALEAPRLPPCHRRRIETEARLLARQWRDPEILVVALAAHLCEHHEDVYRALCDLSRDPHVALRWYLPPELGGV